MKRRIGSIFIGIALAISMIVPAFADDELIINNKVIINDILEEDISEDNITVEEDIDVISEDCVVEVGEETIIDELVEDGVIIDELSDEVIEDGITLEDVDAPQIIDDGVVDIEENFTDEYDIEEDNLSIIYDDEEEYEEDGVGSGYSGISYKDWTQKQSAISNMYSAGCRVTTFARILYETGFTEVGDPDKYYKWGKSTGAIVKNISENGGFGDLLIKFAKSHDGKASIVASKSISGCSSVNSSDVMKYIKNGYYVVLVCKAHTTMFSNSESIKQGVPVIVDTYNLGGKRCYGKYGNYIKLSDYGTATTQKSFTRMVVFSVAKNSCTYNISYVLNGGTNNSSNPKTYVAGKGAKLYNPTRSNYVFEGWYYDSSFKNRATQISTSDSGNKTLYAKWSERNMTINYVLNGGVNSPENLSKLNKKTYSFILKIPQKQGYSFGGWYKNSALTDPVDINCGNDETRIYYREDVNSITLYAKWCKDNTYYVNGKTYKLSDATQVVKCENGYVYEIGDEYVLKEVVVKHDRTIEKYTTNEESVSIYVGSFDLEEIWKLGYGYTLIYDCRIISNDNGYFLRLSKPREMIAQSLSETTGYIQISHAGRVIEFGPSFYVSPDLPRDEQYEYYDLDSLIGGATASHSNPDYVYGLENFDVSNMESLAYLFYYMNCMEEIDLSSFDTANVKNMNAMFTGCSAAKVIDISSFDTTKVESMDDIERNCKMFGGCDCLEVLYTPKKSGSVTTDLPYTMYDESGNAYTQLPVNATKSIKLTKTKPPMYEIIYDANGGTGTMNKQKCYKNVSYALNSNTFKRTGYRFTGWNTSKDGTGKDLLNKEMVKDLIPINSSLILYAQWTPVSYSVEFNANGASEGYMYIQEMDYNESTTLNPNVYARKGYKFNGWNTKKDGSGVKYGNCATVKNLTNINGKNIILYAQWTPIKYKIKYNGNGATSGSIKTQTCTYDKKSKLSANKFRRNGYTFKGWATSKANAKKGKVKYKNKASVKNLTANNGATITLYAVWK